MDIQDIQDIHDYMHKSCTVAVGMLVAQHPPRGSVRAILLHTALTSGI